MQDLFHHAAAQDPIDLWQQIPSDWQAICDPQISKGLLEKISQQLLAAKRAGQEIAPAPENIFRALQLCSVKQARVVILGQDPYQTPGLAQGLAFSIPKEIQPGWRAFPSSLRNISKALQIDAYGALQHGDLTAWAKQGVLLLNATLTVQLNQAGSHAHWGWQALTDHLLERLAQHHMKQQQTLVWLLWGAHAQQKKPLIEAAIQKGCDSSAQVNNQKTDRSGQATQLILTASHPSGLSVYKTKEPFIYPGDQQSCQHFLKTNQFLKAHGQREIQWIS